MKIALVSPYDLAVPGGVNSHIHHLADNFIALGHEVPLVVTQHARHGLGQALPLEHLGLVVAHASMLGAGRAVKREQAR